MDSVWRLPVREGQGREVLDPVPQIGEEDGAAGESAGRDELHVVGVQRIRQFLDYDVEIRRVICCTNAVESLNARYRRAIRARGHSPTEQAAMKYLYLVTCSPDPTGAVRHDGQ